MTETEAVPDVPPPSPQPAHAPFRPSLARAVTAAVGIGVLAGAVIALTLSYSQSPQPDTTDTPSAREAVRVPTGSAESSADSRPPSGTELLPEGPTGNGSLVVENDTDNDAAIVLLESGQQVRALYIRQGERLTVSNIAAGLYTMTMAVGRNWQDGRFLTQAAYKQLEVPVLFAEADQGNEIDATRFSLSLSAAFAAAAGLRTPAPFIVRSAGAR